MTDINNPPRVDRYDLKKIGFSPSGSAPFSAFVFYETPEGSSWWEKNYNTLEGHVRFQQMRDQWRAENEKADVQQVDLTKITTPFGLLDDATREALIAHGGPYEHYGSEGWLNTTHKHGVWCPWHVFRVKPQPEEEALEIDAWVSHDDGQIWLDEGDAPVRVTFNRIDGKIDPSSYKVEAR